LSDKPAINWSEWFEFNNEQISKVPESPGVFRMHASMKIFFIGGAQKLRKALSDAISSPCIRDASRFCYSETEDFEKIKEELVLDYRQRHDGKLPKCM
jgi:hypothetical protein